MKIPDFDFFIGWNNSFNGFLSAVIPDFIIRFYSTKFVNSGKSNEISLIGNAGSDDPEG